MTARSTSRPQGQRRPYAPRVPMEIRREQALDAALDLITDAGLAAVSMEAVAAKLDVAKTVVYKSFSNTDELLVALVDREERHAVQQVREFLPFDVAASQGDPVEATLAGILLFLEAVRHNPGTWRLLVSAEGLPVNALERRRQAIDRVSHNVAALVAWATSQRRSGSLDSELAARTLVAFLETLVELTVEQPAEFPPARVDDYVRTVLHSIITG